MINAYDKNKNKQIKIMRKYTDKTLVFFQAKDWSIETAVRDNINLDMDVNTPLKTFAFVSCMQRNSTSSCKILF